MNTDLQIPVIDFSQFLHGDQKQRNETAKRIRDVGSTVGFLYLSGLGIDQSTVNEVFERSAAFFELTADRKAAFTKAHRINELTQCGYAPLGSERLDPKKPVDIKEAFDVYPNESYTAVVYGAQPSTDPFPEDIQPLGDAFAKMFERCSAVASEVLRALALAFSMPEEYFVSLHGTNNDLRLLHYPGVTGNEFAEHMRVGNHTDFGTITILFQDPNGGLEVLSAEGTWLNAPSVPGTALINIGDLLQQWSNMELRSTQHRVSVNLRNQRTSRSRYSIAFFCEPNNDSLVECLPTARDGANPRFAPVLAGDYLRNRLANALTTVT